MRGKVEGEGRGRGSREKVSKRVAGSYKANGHLKGREREREEPVLSRGWPSPAEHRSRHARCTNGERGYAEAARACNSSSASRSPFTDGTLARSSSNGDLVPLGLSRGSGSGLASTTAPCGVAAEPMAVAAPNNRSDAADCRSDPGRHERWTETAGMRIRPPRFRCVGRAHGG